MVTVQELLEKVTDINDKIEIVERRIDTHGREFPRHEPLWDVIKLLNEYRDLILNTKVNI